MSRKRRTFSQEFKFKVAIEALKNQSTLNELAKKHNLHPNQISQWKQQLLKDGPEVFSSGRTRDKDDWQKTESELYEQIGRLKVENEWLKKKSA